MTQPRLFEVDLQKPPWHDDVAGCVGTLPQSGDGGTIGGVIAGGVIAGGVIGEDGETGMVGVVGVVC